MKFLNPVYKRELKQTARMRRTAVLIFCYNALLAIFGLFSFYITFGNGTRYYQGIHYEDILTIYGIITGIEFMLLLLLVPALTAGAISGEREKQTLDILLTTKLTPFRIITGKLLSSISMMILLAISSLPIIAICFSIGGITLLDLAKFLIFLVVTAIFIGSISIFFSSCCRRTTAATVCSYSAMLVLVLLSAAVVFAVGLVRAMKTEEVYYDFRTLLLFCGRNAGQFVYLLLLNPVFSFLSMLRDQTGYGSKEGYMLITSEGMGRFLLEHWFTISIVIQLAAALLFLILAAWKLNPVKRKKSN